MQKVMITMPPDLLSAVDAIARRLGLNRSQFIRESVSESLKRLQQEEFEALMAEGYQEIAEEDLKDAEAYVAALLDLEGETE